MKDALATVISTSPVYHLVPFVISNEVRDLYKGTLFVSHEGDFSLRSK
jgi:hypothetical protein